MKLLWCNIGNAVWLEGFTFQHWKYGQYIQVKGLYKVLFVEVGKKAAN
jgi:hypothetical protein